MVRRLAQYPVTKLRGLHGEAAVDALQLAAMVGGLTLDTVTAHGDLNAETLKTVLRSYWRQLLYAANPH